MFLHPGGPTLRISQHQPARATSVSVVALCMHITQHALLSYWLYETASNCVVDTYRRRAGDSGRVDAREADLSSPPCLGIGRCAVSPHDRRRRTPVISLFFAFRGGQWSRVFPIQLFLELLAPTLGLGSGPERRLHFGRRYLRWARYIRRCRRRPAYSHSPTTHHDGRDQDSQDCPRAVLQLRPPA